jgi:hypothetical protein
VVIPLTLFVVRKPPLEVGEDVIIVNFFYDCIGIFLKAKSIIK